MRENVDTKDHRQSIRAVVDLHRSPLPGCARCVRSRTHGRAITTFLMAVVMTSMTSLGTCQRGTCRIRREHRYPVTRGPGLCDAGSVCSAAPVDRHRGCTLVGRVTCLDERAGADPTAWHRTDSINRECVVGRSSRPPNPQIGRSETPRRTRCEAAVANGSPKVGPPVTRSVLTRLSAKLSHNRGGSSRDRADGGAGGVEPAMRLSEALAVSGGLGGQIWAIRGSCGRACP
jgi:hypothetical protein